MQEGVDHPKPSVSFEVGENVRVSDGPFASFNGVVEETVDVPVQGWPGEVGFVTEPLVAIGIFFFTGLFNMLFIIPTITLFQQLTPQRLMGRVISSRQALVYGAIAASMGLSGWLADLIGADMVLVVAGVHSLIHLPHGVANVRLSTVTN